MEPLQNAAPFSIEGRLHLLVTGGFLLEGDCRRGFCISRKRRGFSPTINLRGHRCKPPKNVRFVAWFRERRRIAEPMSISSNGFMQNSERGDYK